jgi:hypothetical protein
VITSPKLKAWAALGIGVAIGTLGQIVLGASYASIALAGVTALGSGLGVWRVPNTPAE